MLKLSKKWKPWLNNHYRFKVAFGGRAGGKSWTIATILLIIASQKKLRIACLREYQKSLADSAYKLLCDLIRADDALSSFYRIYISIALRGRMVASLSFRVSKTLITSSLSKGQISHGLKKLKQYLTNQCRS